jgi:DNA modification methylase
LAKEMLAECGQWQGDEGGEVVEDDVPDVAVNTVTKPGDLWVLGNHRLLCGDATSEQQVARLLKGNVVKCLITDPPYGIEWQGSNASTLQWDGIANDSGSLNLKPILEKYEIVVAFGANCYPQHLPHRGRWICWDKRVNENADRMLGSPFELAWSNKTSGFDRMYRVMHGGVVNDDGHNARRVHPTQKPVRLMASIISDYSEGGDVIDLFLGSGTTLIACEQLGKKCYGMEISPQYCDVIVKRWENLTGNKAVLETDNA